MRLSSFVSENRKAVLSLVLLLCALGAYFASHLPVAIFPQLTVPRIAIAQPLATCIDGHRSGRSVS